MDTVVKFPKGQLKDIRQGDKPVEIVKREPSERALRAEAEALNRAPHAELDQAIREADEAKSQETLYSAPPRELTPGMREKAAEQAHQLLESRKPFTFRTIDGALHDNARVLNVEADGEVLVGFKDEHGDLWADDVSLEDFAVGISAEAEVEAPKPKETEGSLTQYMSAAADLGRSLGEQATAFAERMKQYLPSAEEDLGAVPEVDLGVQAAKEQFRVFADTLRFMTNATVSRKIDQFLMNARGIEQAVKVKLTPEISTIEQAQMLEEDAHAEMVQTMATQNDLLANTILGANFAKGEAEGTDPNAPLSEVEVRLKDIMALERSRNEIDDVLAEVKDTANA